ncbi:MAG: DUF5915 domain-containing protein, partial [Bacteroidota bacterium]
VVSTGLVLDKDGRKMSKRLGNTVNPFKTLAEYGADPTRWYMMSNSNPWDNLKFDIAGVKETRNKFFGTLYNTYSFFVLYANIDQFAINEQDVTPMEERPEIDRWIISKLYSLLKLYHTEMNDYNVTAACRAIESFVMDDLSNWYVRLCRRRFWKGEMSADKRAAYETLYQSLMMVAQMMSPIAPFFSELLYRNLTAPIKEAAIKNDTPLRHESIHLTDLTEVEEHLIDLELEERMDYAQRISSLTFSLRKKESLRVRQPLQKIMLPILDERFQEQVEGVKDLIASEVNVKEIEYLTDTSGVIKKKIKPNFKTLGRRLGKNMKVAAQAISKFSQEDIASLEKSGAYSLQVGDESYDLTLEDFEITAEDIPGLLVANDGALTVALDINITDELAAEGMARELVNRIQNIRKGKDFDVTDRIQVQIEQHEAVQAAVAQFGDYIKNEVLADVLELVETVADGESVELPGAVGVLIGVQK